MTVLPLPRPAEAPRACSGSCSRACSHVLAARTGALLRAGVPLTLLLDLGDPSGPRSRELYAGESSPGAWWRARP